jgi:hypothetical protein
VFRICFATLRMSETPTYASLLTQWSGGDLAARRGVYAHLRANPAEAAAVEASIRDELKNGWPWKRVIAAEAILEVYRDEGAAAGALATVLREDLSPAAADAVPLLERLAPHRCGPLLVEFAQHAPTVFRAQPRSFHRWAGATAIRAGADAPGLWANLLAHAGSELEAPLLMGLADAAREVDCDLAAVEPVVRQRLLNDSCGYAAGAALWRLTWRINRHWLASIDPESPRFDGDRDLLVLLIEVLTEHLGRRRDLAPLVRELLVRVGDGEEFQTGLNRLAKFGGRGWTVLLPILSDLAVSTRARVLVFNEAAARPAVLPLAHHHAHAVLLEGEHAQTVPLPELLGAAVGVLRAIGAPAGPALADILNLIVKQPEAARLLAPAILALAPGFPNPAHAVARTLDRLRRSQSFRTDAFAALAEVFAAMNLDGAPLLAEDTSFDLRTPDLLLQQPAWRNAPPETRTRHAAALAERLSSPRIEVRTRAADFLRHYPEQMPAVWPALVAFLTGRDETAVLHALRYFRHLAPVADEVRPELTALFREPDPALAARAVVALWRLGRMPTADDELRAAVLNSTGDEWAWAVLRGAVERVGGPARFEDLPRVFAADPADVVARVRALLNPTELPEEVALSTHIRPENQPAARVNWNGVYQCVCNDPEGGLLFLALMLAHGSGGFASQKVWMIKHHRGQTGVGLAESKQIIERIIDRMNAGVMGVAPRQGDRRACVRDYFIHSTDVPASVTALLEHRLSWYRWAALELLDAWGAPGLPPALLEDRIWDHSALVRIRALKMYGG